MQRPIEIRDLLAHTSGIGFGPGFGYEANGEYEEPYVALAQKMDNYEVPSLKVWCEELAKIPLRFQPGSDWGYGYSSDVLGRVIEVVSGMSLVDYLTSVVLKPLSMHDTKFALAPADEHTQRLAALHRREPVDGSGQNPQILTVDPCGATVPGVERKVLPPGKNGGAVPAAWPAVPSTSVFVEPNANPVPQGGGCVCSVAGGFVSTMSDYARFGQMLLNGGVLDGIRILETETVGLLQRDWVNDFVSRKRRKPIFVWGNPGAGFSPLGQVGFEHPEATGPRVSGKKLRTVQWGGAGGSGYMINWPDNVLVLTYSGCIYDTATQDRICAATFGAVHRGSKAKRSLRKATVIARANVSKRVLRALRRAAQKSGVRRKGLKGD